MEDIFKKIEDNIFESQTEEETYKIKKSNDLSDDTTEDSSKLTKIIKKVPKSEVKNKDNSKFILDKDENEEEKEEADIDEDEYADYGRINKTGIHFQIISDYNVSIEIVPDELLRDDVKDLILKYKGIFDTTMNLWVIPYVNYELLYNELYKIEGINRKLHKVGSIAKQCYENKTLTTLIIRRKKKEEKIDYLNDNSDGNLDRNVEKLPDKLRKALYDFQVEGIKFGVEHHCRFLLADEMGVGKTIQAIALAYLYRDSWPVLIVCPGSMKYLWKGEIQTWLGLKDKRINMLNRGKQKISDEAYFYIISYDLVSHILKKLKKMTFDFVILDEAHSIKNRESLRAKNILPLAIRAKRLILMTGTPLLAKPLEGYPLLYALRPDLFSYFKKYAYRYCDPQPTPFGVTWSGTSNTKELHWLLSTLMIRRLKKDVLNRLPPKRRQKVTIDTDPEIIAQIKDARTKIKGRTGTLEAYTLTAKAKKEGVCEYISDLLETEEKFVIFAYHYEMLNRIETLIKDKKIDYIRIDGSTKQDKRYEYVTKFQKNEDCQVAILSIIASSTGITLNAAHIVVFAELTWTPSIMIQAEDRVHRIGQKGEFVDIKYLYGKETLDDFILDKLQKKLIIVSTTIDDKKENFGVKANPDLIHPEGKNSKELIKMDKGEINSSYEDTDSEDDDNNDNAKNIEKKMLNELKLALGDGDEDEDGDQDNPNKNKNKNKRKKRKKNQIENKKYNYPKNDIESELSDSNLDINIDQEFFDSNKLLKNEENIQENNNINSNNNYFNNINDNINEIENQEMKYPNNEIKLTNNYLYIDDNNNNNLKNKNIQYPKQKFQLNLHNDNFNNMNMNMNKKEIKYPKEDKEININTILYTEENYSNNLNNKKVNNLKREKTPSASDGKRENKHKKLSAFKALIKRWASNNKEKSHNKNNKKSFNHKNNQNNNSNQNIITQNPNYLQDENNEIDIDKNIKNNNNNNNKVNYIKNSMNEEKINNNIDNFQNFDKDLMINLHKFNMRRNVSQEETKQTQLSIDLDDKQNAKLKTEQKRLLFPTNKNIFNEKFDDNNNNNKVPLI